MAVRESHVTLVTMDETVLEQLIEVATTDAAADDVTPPVTLGPEWTPARIDWLREFHRERRAGLDGPAREATWGISVDQRIVGSVRLQRTQRPDRLETGLWVTRSARGRGVGRAAIAAVLSEAFARGFTAVSAETTTSNVGAMTILRQLGFTLTPAEDGPGVHALLVLSPEP